MSKRVLKPAGSKPVLKLAAFAAVASIVAAGCGGSSNSEGAYGGSEASGTEAASTTSGRSYGYGSTGATNASAETEQAATVSVASVPKLGRVLVDSEGFTLYEFEKDKGTTSSCYGPCAKNWPPLLTKGSPQPSNGASTAKLGTTKRSDGTLQVTYAGRPLYTFVSDAKPGDAKGNNFDAFGADWYALTPQGSHP
jgi:predicted lipoprotein with Yx(FWY)xxD motif